MRNRVSNKARAMACRWFRALSERPSPGPRARSFPGTGTRTPLLGGAVLLAAGCAGPPPDDLGPSDDGGLRPCDPVPVCVHTGQVHPEEYPPFRLSPEWRDRDPGEVRRELAGVVEALPRTEVVTRQGPYLHAEAQSRLLRRVDDLELHWEAGDAEVIVRSEARGGRSDFGRNLRRVETLRQGLLQRGVLEQGRAVLEQGRAGRGAGGVR